MPGYQSHSLFSATGYPTLPFDPGRSNYDGSVLRDTTVPRGRWRGEGCGARDESDARKREPREESFSVARRYGYGWDFRGIFGKMRQRSETGRIVFMNCASVGKPSAERSRAEFRSRRSLRYSGADFVMEESCYSILINNGGRRAISRRKFQALVVHTAV